MKKILALFFLTTVISIPNGFSALRGEFLGAGVLPMATGVPAPTGKLALGGGGLVLSVPLKHRFRFELGYMYLKRDVTLDQQYKFNMHSFMGGFKIEFPKVVFLDLGGYSNNYINNPLPVGGKDYGAYAGLGLNIPFSPFWGLEILGQYRYALNKLKSVDETITYTPHEAVLMAGIRIGM